MSAEWTPEQTETWLAAAGMDFNPVTEASATVLDLMPEGMMIEVYREHWRCWEKLVHDDDQWVTVGDAIAYRSRELIGCRVQPFGVPIEALLEASDWPLAHVNILSAIAHCIRGAQ